MNNLLRKLSRIGMPLILAVATLQGGALAQADRWETASASYSNLAGIRDIHYKSRFFGYQSGVSRDFIHYGVSFADPVTQHLDWENRQVLLADLNHDGISDLAGYQPGTGEVVWMPGKGDGSFGESRSLRLRPHGHWMAADFNGDGRQDLGVLQSGKLFVRMSNGDASFGTERVLARGLSDPFMVAGDFNGDGVGDLCGYNGETGTLRVYFGLKADGFSAPRVQSWGRPIGGALVAADLNGDHFCDLALYDSTLCPDGFAFRFGRGDGGFGPTAKERRTLVGEGYGQLWSNLPWSLPNARIQPLAGLVNSDASADIGIYDTRSGDLLLRVQKDEPAYNYSVHLIKDGSGYRMWHGGRWHTLDAQGKPIPNSDGDHVLSAWSKDGRTWYRRLDAPEFLKGEEIGCLHEWWSKNLLEPEVLRIGGRYYMFWQVMIQQGDTQDTGERVTVGAADRIGLATSEDGSHWTRKTDRGVIVNVPNGCNIDHQEVIYIPDDPDGKPWWLYTFHFMESPDKKGSLYPAGHVRIRSNDPTTFDWNRRERVEGMSQIGNQIAYAEEAPGRRTFFRITFTGKPDSTHPNGVRMVPTFNISRDGLHWVPANVTLAFSSTGEHNQNAYFLGLSTVDGTGKLESLGNGTYRAFYAATTCTTSVAPEIFYSKIGVGEVLISLK